MIEHLDCLTYRLDAWQTALCYKKLEMNRKSGIAAGTVMGAYGWLENLKPASNIKWIKETDLPTELQPGTGKPVIQADNHAGYIHAPSLTQAKTAALLRNAYLHYHDANDPQMMAINLSSGRVRKGLEIFEGIQKGHAINELLGYRLERYLHDQSTPLDKYIPYLRAAFPLGGKILANAGNAHEQSSITQANKPADWIARLDGLAIVNAIKSGKSYPFNIAQLPSAGAEAGSIQEGIDELTDCIDAMKDLLVAESIHQVVQGNTDRAGALLKSIHELKAPSKFEFIQTPRTPAEILTHRASLFFKPGDFEKPLNPWPKVNMSQRANTEPGLNEWLAEMIGPPDLFQCTVTETKSRTNAIITIEDLDLQPIDLVYLAPTEFNKDNSEFSRRIAYYYRTTQNISEETTIEIDYNATVKNAPSFADLLPLLKLLKELVTGSKALDAADFDLKQYNGKTNFENLSVEKSGTAKTDIGSLLKRISSLTTSLQSLLKKLDQTVHARSATMCADIRKCLIACCDFEIRDAFPISSFGEDQILRDALIKQGTEVMAQMQKMLDSIPANNDVNVEALLKVFAVFFGPAFKVLPVFHFSKKEDDEIERVSSVEDAANAENAIFSFVTGKTNMGREKHVEQWLSELSYLRPKNAA
jgi:hypothetical protein